MISTKLVRMALASVSHLPLLRALDSVPLPSGAFWASLFGRGTETI